MEGGARVGEILMIFGAILLVAGALVAFGDRIPFLGRLPGDFTVRRGNFTFYFPLATSILVSVLVTLALHLFRK